MESVNNQERLFAFKIKQSLKLLFLLFVAAGSLLILSFAIPSAFAQTTAIVFTLTKLGASTFINSPEIGYNNSRIPVSADAVQYSSAVMFKRMWSSLQPGQNDFSGIDALLADMQRAKDAGLQVRFHLIPYNISSGVPVWYRNKANDPGVTIVRGWCAFRSGPSRPGANEAIFFAPNMDHPEYVPAIERLMNEIAQRIQGRFPDDPKLLAWFRIGGAGAFGEWLNSISRVNCNDPNPTNPVRGERIDMPTLANARRLVDAFIDAGQMLSRLAVVNFSSTRYYVDSGHTGDWDLNSGPHANSSLIRALTPDTHPLLYALSRGAGWASSAIEEPNTQTRIGQWIAEQPLFRDAWRRAPLDAEPARGGDPTLLGNPDGKSAMLNYMLGRHFSSYRENSESWFEPTPTTNGTMNFLTHAGYRLTVDNVTVTPGASNVSTVLRIGNDGNAPPYDRYRVGVRLRGRSTVTGFTDPNTTTWLPGIFNDVTVNVPRPAAGTYEVDIKVYDAANEQRSLPLAITSPLVSGDWYRVGGVSMTSPTDTLPPIRSNGAPTGTLPAGTASTTMSVTTHENATCRYSATTGTTYASMTSTFSTTGGTSHSTTIGVTNGQTYTRYIRCQDTAGNANTSDHAITFSVAAAPAPTPACTQFIGYSQTLNWYGEFEAALGPSTANQYQLLLNGGGAMVLWQDPNYTGWDNALVSPCTSNPSAPNRVVLDVTHNRYLTTANVGSDPVGYMETIIRSVIATTRSKYPSVGQISLKPVVGAPSHSNACPSSFATPVPVIRATYNHPIIYSAIQRIAASPPAGITVSLGHDAHVGTCSHYINTSSDHIGHLTQAGQDYVGPNTAGFYRP